MKNSSTRLLRSSSIRVLRSSSIRILRSSTKSLKKKNAPTRSTFGASTRSTLSASTSIRKFDNDCGGHRLDSMPDDIYDFYLFKFLHLNDIFNLKQVSKKFYSIVKSYEIKELAFANYSKRNLTCPFESGKTRNLVDYSKFGLLINPSNDNLLNLKVLQIFGTLRIKLKDLNKFTKLQKLKIDKYKLDDCFNDLLQLSELKELRIAFFYDHCNVGIGLITIDTPNLEWLDLNHYGHLGWIKEDLVIIKHPLSIKRLIFSGRYEKMPKFTNLECLELSIWDQCVFEVINFVLNLPNLLKLKIHYISSNMMQKANGKLKDLFIRKKKDLEIILNRVRIKNVNKFDEYKEFVYNDSVDLKFQLDNYDELDSDQEYFGYLNYTKLIHLLPNNLPADFFDKYCNLLMIKVEGQCLNEDRLIQFIKKCKLSALKIRSSSLSQQFFDQLPSISSLTRLGMKNNGVKLNFKFIMRMNYICSLKTDQEIRINKNFNLNDLKYLRWIEFKLNKEIYGFSKLGNDRYSHYIREESEYEDLNFDELVKWFKNLQESKKRKLSK